MIGWAMKLLGDILYMFNDRGPEKAPRAKLIEGIIEFCYRTARTRGIKMEWR